MPTTIIEGDYAFRNEVIRLYNAGNNPADIARQVDKPRAVVLRHLRAAERWGDVKRRSNGLFSEGACSLPREKRTCGKADFLIISTVCQACEHRAKVTREQ
jgi:hypothetical protein